MRSEFRLAFSLSWIFVAGFVLCALVTTVPAGLGWPPGASSRLTLALCYTLSVAIAATLLMGGLSVFLLKELPRAGHVLPYAWAMCFVGWAWLQLTREYGVVELSPSLSVGGLFALGYLQSFLLGIPIARGELIPEERHAGWVLFAPLVMIATLLMTGLVNIPFVHLAGFWLRK